MHDRDRAWRVVQHHMADRAEHHAVDAAEPPGANDEHLGAMRRWQQCVTGGAGRDLAQYRDLGVLLLERADDLLEPFLQPA